MFIKSLELNNFRCHKYLSVEFKDGVNLILGKNGAGKSSILEAIGYALLNINNGREVKDQILRGEKKSLINLVFTGNDGIDYRIEKKIAASATTKLFRIGDDFPILNDNKSILAKNGELLGLSSNAENLYAYVITAYQNRFIDVFRSKQDNDLIINKIFNTEIYRNLWKFTKDNYLDNLSVVKNKKEGALTGLSIDIKDIKELENSLKISTDKLNSVSNEISNIEIKKNELNNSIKELENIKIEIDKFNSDKANTEKLINETNNSINLTNEKLEVSKHARNSLEINKDSYNRYNQINKQITDLDKQIKILDKSNKELDKSNKELNNTEQEIIKLDSAIKSLNQDTLAKEIEKSEYQAKMLQIQDDINTLTIEKVQIDTELEAKGKSISEAKKSINTISKIESEIKKNIALIENNKVEKPIDEIQTETEILNNKHKELENNKIEKDKLIQQINNLKDRIEDINDSHKQLSNGLCPILKEDCRNISGDISINDYFTNKTEMLNKEIQVLENTIVDKYSDIDNHLKKSSKQIAELNEELKSAIKKYEKSSELENTNLLLNKDIEIETIKLNNTLKNIEIESIDDYIELVKKLDEIINELNIKSNSNKVKLNEIQKVSDSLEESIAKLMTGIENNKKQIIDYQEKNSNHLSLSNELKNKIDELNEILKDFDSLKQNRDELNLELSNLKNAYEEYNKNLKIAEQETALQLELDTYLNNLKEYKQQIEKYIDKIDKMSKLFDIDTLNNTISEVKNIEIRIREMIDEKLNLSNEKTSIENELKQTIDKISQIENLKVEMQVIDNKIKLTEEYRANLNEMGRLATEKMLKKIEIIATDNYRKLSNKNETLRWLNDGKNYSIQLISDIDKSRVRNYEMLSGGEQVTVALSMRAALSSQLTSTRFAIFDEPTINLDTERKIALSESLNLMLKSMQTIIVTHDDIFRETAANIIEL